MSEASSKNNGHRVKKSDTAPQPLFNNQFPFLNPWRFQRAVTWNSLKTRLILTITLAVTVLMTMAGYVTYRISQDFISSALERSTRLQVMAIRHEIESFLEDRKKTLLFLANQDIDEATAQQFLMQLRAIHNVDYRSILVLRADGNRHLLVCAKGDRTAVLPASAMDRMVPDPRGFVAPLLDLAPGAVWMSALTASELPFDDGRSGGLARVSDHLFTMGTRGRSGYLFLSFNAKAIRNILSEYNSLRSPLYAFHRTPEVRYSYLFDTDGWILFQSEDPESPDADLTTYLARTGLAGTLGRPGTPGAFRPAARHGRFWKMVGAVKEGRHDAERLDADGPETSGKEAFLAFAPIRFNPGAGAPPVISAGIGYMDVSRLTTAAGYKHLDAMFLIVLFTAAVMIVTIYILGHLLTRPILNLADRVRRLTPGERLQPIDIPGQGAEVLSLRDAINQMIATVNRQMEEIRQRDVTIHRVSQREPAAMTEAMAAALPEELARVSGIVGFGAKLDKLRSEILKAARVDADVLIQGETGTGKQLAAEAIHRLSGRAPQPFISINCGALDEQLLLDTLFGHVRGAFTEARADRKGAFLQADGGTLFLDEIQSASPRVQQSLLRAIAMRRIRPLGSDAETEVNVRLIAAANADLRGLIEKGLFREDLFFRLMVIPIHTPPLREIPDNIPVLADHYLQQHRHQSHREDLKLSRGAVERLCRHRWPGNIRELQHCIMRAVVMTDSPVIQAEDIVLDTGAMSAAPAENRAPEPPDAGAAVPGGPPPGLGETDGPPLPPGLSPRQQQAWPAIVSRGSVRRQDYHQWCGEAVSTRTAIYDLQDLVARGLLVPAGRGRSARYAVPGKDPSAEGSDNHRN